MATQALSTQLPLARDGSTIGLPGWVMRCLEVIVLISFVVVIEPAPTDLMFVVMGLCLLLTGRFYLPATFHPLMWAGVFAFLIGDLVSLTFIRVNAGRALFSWGVSVYMIVSFVTYAALLSKGGPGCTQRVLRALQVAGIACTVMGLIGMTELLPLGTFFYRDDAALRIRSTFKDPNVMGPFLVPAFLITLERLRQRTGTGWINLISLFGVSIVLLLCFSRAAWLNLFVALAIFVFLHMKLNGNLSHGISLMLIGGAFIFLIGGLVLIAGDSLGFGDYLSSRLSLQHYDSQRFRHYAMALQLCAEHPLGIGPMQTTRVFGMQVHNLYLGVAAESGLLAATGLLSMILATLHRAVTLAVKPGAHRAMFIVILACLCGQLVNSLFVNSMHWRHLFLLLALPWSVPISSYAADRRSMSLIPQGVQR